jgi:hypothetical protein
VDFHVVNSKGTLLLATPCRDIAKARAKEASQSQDGVEVFEVTVTTTRRRAYKPAPPKVSSVTSQPISLAMAGAAA